MSQSEAENESDRALNLPAQRRSSCQCMQPHTTTSISVAISRLPAHTAYFGRRLWPVGGWQVEWLHSSPDGTSAATASANLTSPVNVAQRPLPRVARNCEPVWRRHEPVWCQFGWDFRRLETRPTRPGAEFAQNTPKTGRQKSGPLRATRKSPALAGFRGLPWNRLVLLEWLAGAGGYPPRNSLPLKSLKKRHKKAAPTAV